MWQLPCVCLVLSVHRQRAAPSTWRAPSMPPVSRNVRWRLLWWVMGKPDYSCQEAGNNAAWCFVSPPSPPPPNHPCFQRHLFFDKVPETVSDMLLGTYGKEYTFYQLCFPYPLVTFAGCGNRQHFGHCCSEIAFTEQSSRTGCIQPGEPGARHSRMVHRDGQCTLSLVWTQRTKERFYCKVWQVLFADVLSLSLCPRSPSLCVYLLPPCCSHVTTYIFCYLSVPTLLMTNTLVPTTLSFFSLSPSYFLLLSHLYIYVHTFSPRYSHFFFFFFYWHPPPSPPSVYSISITEFVNILHKVKNLRLGYERHFFSLPRFLRYC